MAEPRWPVGTPLEVRNRFDRAWAGGFEVAAVRDEGPTYRVRRLSDRAVLPAVFVPAELRVEQR